ncbi:MAG: glycosyltransferase family 4 protein [Blastocatellia bacterium]|nr:glycosyltransferase family 4 protein [Blastocatellia bacterium]
MPSSSRYRLAIVTTHPVQYYVPWYRALAAHPEIEVEVFYCYRQSQEGQAQAGFGVNFEWDVPLFEGYKWHFLENVAKNPNVFGFSGCDTPEIATLVREGRFDAFLVQGWYVKSFWQTMRACWKYRVPLLVRGDSQLANDRSWLKRMAKYGFYRWFLRRFSAVLPVGQRSREYYAYYGVSPEKMFFAPHTVDNEFFSNRAAHFGGQGEALRRRWGIPLQARVIVFVGKLIPIKRPQDLVKAALHLKTLVPESHVVLVGDGPLRPELEALVQHHDLPVTFAGFLNQSEISQAYSIAEVLVLCSESETWGLVVNEAMACGVPTVVTETVGCAPDLIVPGKTGAVVPVGNPEQLAKAIQDILAGGKGREEWAFETRQQIQKYSLAVAVEGTVQALRHVVSGQN